MDDESEFRPVNRSTGSASTSAGDDKRAGGGDRGRKTTTPPLANTVERMYAAATSGPSATRGSDAASSRISLADVVYLVIGRLEELTKRHIA